MPPQTNKRSPAKKAKAGRASGKGRPTKGKSTKSSRGKSGSIKGRPAKGRRAKGRPAASANERTPVGRKPASSFAKHAPHAAQSNEGDRLQKVLSSAGIASRRECEQLILDGRVQVDGKVVTELGTRVVIGKHEVRFDCEPIELSKPRYYLVNKPMGVVSTNRDQEGRPRVIDLVPPSGHLFTVGRLDRTSEGLILVTNDGELANKLAHPRYEIPKVYRVTVAGHPTAKSLQQLRRGVWIAEGQVRVSELTVKKRQTKNTILEMVLTEGRNREIRRMAAKIGHKVLELRRIAMGPLRLGDVPAGAYRELTSREIKSLKDSLKGKKRSTRRRPGPKSSARPSSGGKRKVNGSKPGARSKPGKGQSASRKPTNGKTKRKSSGRKMART